MISKIYTKLFSSRPILPQYRYGIKGEISGGKVRLFQYCLVYFLRILKSGCVSATYLLPKNYSRGTIGYISNSCSSKYLMRLGIAFNIFFAWDSETLSERCRTTNQVKKLSAISSLFG